jgi:hypothetical protein
VSLGPELLVQELDSHMAFNDGMADQLARECENGRLFRLAARLCTVVDRPEGDGIDHQWSETGAPPPTFFRPQNPVWNPYWMRCILGFVLLRFLSMAERDVTRGFPNQLPWISWNFKLLNMPPKCLCSFYKAT